MSKRLKEKDRYLIEKCLKKKMQVKDIAKLLDVNISTVYREIKKGMTRQIDSQLREHDIYLADVAQRKTKENKSRSGRKPKLSSDHEDIQNITALIINQKYSPEAAFYVLNIKSICKKTFYNYVHKNYIPDLKVTQLPYAKAKKKKKQNKITKKKYHSPEKSIENRPKEIDKRDIYGHWEMDTVYSSRDDKSALLVLTERSCLEEILVKTKDRTVESIIKGLNRLERRIGAQSFREKFKTITCDNGVEFSDWEQIEKSCINKKTPRTQLFYCHPYRSGERGSNENQNRFVRRWIPKGDDIGLYTDNDIKKIENWMNNYPRPQYEMRSSLEQRAIMLCS